MTRIFTALAIVCFAFGLQAVTAEDKETGTTVKDLIGLYDITEGEKNGEKLPPNHLKGHKVRFTDNKIVATDHENKDTFSCTYKLDSSKSPAVITMTSTTKGHEGTVAKGLVMSAGDDVKLNYTLPEGKDMPMKFKTSAGQLMVVMKKAKE